MSGLSINVCLTDLILPILSPVIPPPFLSTITCSNYSQWWIHCKVMMVCLRSDTFTAGSTSAFPCIIVAGENGTSRPTLMGCHDYYHTSLQFITSISSPVYLLLCCFFHLSVLIFLFFFSDVSLLSPSNLWPPEHKWSCFSLKRRHFAGVTSCLKGTIGGQSNIPSMLGANGWANMNNTLHSCVCVCVCLYICER